MSNFKLKLSEEIKNLIFFCEGGIGKNISSTAVVRAIKKQFPTKNIIVVAGCPEIFMNNPNVKRVFNFGNPLHFYEDFIDQNPNSYILKTEPYLHYDYVNKKRHVVDCWCEMLGIEPDGIEPDIFFTPNELEAVNLYVNEILDVKHKQKLAIFQWVGGKVPQKNTDKDMKVALAEMYRRAMPKDQAQAIVNFLVQERNCKVILIQHENFPKLENAEVVKFPMRAVLSLLTKTDYFIGVDSFMQHAAAAKQINKRGLVFWGGTSATCLGYTLHNNWQVESCTTPACHRPNSYLMDLQVNGMMWDCPWGEPCMKRDINKIKSVMDNEFKFKKTTKQKQGAKNEKVNANVSTDGDVVCGRCPS